MSTDAVRRRGEGGNDDDDGNGALDWASPSSATALTEEEAPHHGEAYLDFPSAEGGGETFSPPIAEEKEGGDAGSSPPPLGDGAPRGGREHPSPTFPSVWEKLQKSGARSPRETSRPARGSTRPTGGDAPSLIAPPPRPECLPATEPSPATATAAVAALGDEGKEPGVPSTTASGGSFGGTPDPPAGGGDSSPPPPPPPPPPRPEFFPATEPPSPATVVTAAAASGDYGLEHGAASTTTASDDDDGVVPVPWLGGTSAAARPEFYAPSEPDTASSASASAADDDGVVPVPWLEATSSTAAAARPEFYAPSEPDTASTASASASVSDWQESIDGDAKSKASAAASSGAVPVSSDERTRRKLASAGAASVPPDGPEEALPLGDNAPGIRRSKSPDDWKKDEKGKDADPHRRGPARSAQDNENDGGVEGDARVASEDVGPPGRADAADHSVRPPPGLDDRQSTARLAIATPVVLDDHPQEADVFLEEGGRHDDYANDPYGSNEPPLVAAVEAAPLKWGIFDFADRRVRCFLASLIIGAMGVTGLVLGLALSTGGGEDEVTNPQVAVGPPPPTPPPTSFPTRTFEPSEAPSPLPSAEPTISREPSQPPTLLPSDFPTITARPSDPPTTHPSAAPSSSPSSVKVPLTNLLSPLLPSDESRYAFSQEGTPQNRAFEWLASDPKVASYVDSRTIQRFVLATLYYDTNGTDWTGPGGTSWLHSDGSECDWDGIDCDPSFEVKNLILPNYGMKGNLPEELMLLGNSLKALKIYGNDFPNAIPSYIGNLTKLEELNLNDNNLVGPIPTSIGNLRDLEFLFLSQNRLTGSIPSELGYLTNARQAILYKNRLNGTLPIEMFNMTQLVYLSLHSNELSGTLPNETGRLRRLQGLQVQNNQFGGRIPSQIGKLKSMNNLQFERNDFTGTVPAEVCVLKEKKSSTWISADCSDDAAAATAPEVLCDTPECCDKCY